LYRVLADLQADIVDIAFARELAVFAVDLLALAAQADLLPQKKSRHIEARIREVRLLGFAVGIASRARCVGHTETLQELGVEVQLAALPESDAEIARHGPGLAARALGRQAVGAAIERGERRIALVDESGLAVDLPGARPTVVGLLFLLVLHTELVVQTDAKLMQIILRIVTRRRRAEQVTGQAEVGVEVLEARRPARVEAVVEAAAHRPADADVSGAWIRVH